MAGQTQTKKYRSKFFRVAVEGGTTDGRVIERSWLTDMAATYDATKYGARIWMEHIRSTLADSPFSAYGDVVALKAEEIELDGQKKMALFAQIEPTERMVNMVNVLKQKIYTSIEVAEKFAGTTKAYLVGLGITDTPASLGTERLAFAAQHPDAKIFGHLKQNAENLFSAAVEAAIEFEEVTAEPTALDKLMSTFAAAMARISGGEAVKPAPAANTTSADFAALLEPLSAISEHLKTQGTQFAQLQRDLTKLQSDHQTLSARLATTPDPAQPHRPANTGTPQTATTDC
ncbi:GPO family capsid scaffolding protein [Pseudoxanthomonas winnipegensis]|uniref:Phage capsid protein n=1 Tax=Pseudoxanthomonas winnipegensis TaxID=2480810 RepID=A0A4Q8LDD1_9GAMM|nr:GPO family capsid scaffolding protein [Pseudoxanthomonas winnipegensis]TAA26580.1 phage capsid protein [Pseudoxanthomonas winnipegensis]